MQDDHCWSSLQRQLGQVLFFWSHGSRQDWWYIWEQFIRMSLSPVYGSSKHILQVKLTLNACFYWLLPTTKLPTTKLPFFTNLSMALVDAPSLLSLSLNRLIILSLNRLNDDGSIENENENDPSLSLNKLKSDFIQPWSVGSCSCSWSSRLVWSITCYIWKNSNFATME